MKKLYRSVAILSVAGFLITAAAPAQAQRQGGGGRGGFDPAEMQQRMLDRYREMLKVTDDDEWAIISERVTAVTTAQRNARSGAFGAIGRGGFGGGRGGGGGQRGGGGGDRPDQGDRPDRGPRGGGGNQAGSAETQALRTALDEGASAAVVKEKLAALRKVKAEAQAKLVKAQNDLKEVLNTNQEATSVMIGLIP